MTVISTPTALTEATPTAGPRGPSLTEQNFDVVLGNKFLNEPGKRLYVRNTTAGLLGVAQYGDLNGNEVPLLDPTIANNQVPANGVLIMGPFPPSTSNDHSVSCTGGNACNGSVLVKAQGTAGQLKCCPFVSLNP